MKIILVSFWLALLSLIVAGARKATLVQQAPAKYVQLPNPYEANEVAARAGSKLFSKECAACHGKDARGISNAPPLVIPDVTRAAPGALFWVLRDGSLRRGMPSYAHLPEPECWQIVTYLKTLR